MILTSFRGFVLPDQVHSSDTLQSQSQLPHKGTDHSFGVLRDGRACHALSVGITQSNSKMSFEVSASKILCQSSEKPLCRNRHQLHSNQPLLHG